MALPTMLSTTFYRETANADPQVQSVTISASTEYLLVAIGFETVTIDGVTWDNGGADQAMTNVAELSTAPSTTNQLSVFELASPTTGTVDISINLSAIRKVSVAILPFGDVDTGTPRGNGTSTDSGVDVVTAISDSIAIDSNSLAIAGILKRTMSTDNSVTDNANQTALGSVTHGGPSNDQYFLAGSTKTLDGSMGYTWTTAQRANLFIAQINGVSAMAAERYEHLLLLGVG